MVELSLRYKREEGRLMALREDESRDDNRSDMTIPSPSPPLSPVKSFCEIPVSIPVGGISPIPAPNPRFLSWDQPNQNLLQNPSLQR
ncbi:unnamed protein product [Prunus armeniaca]